MTGQEIYSNVKYVDDYPDKKGVKGVDLSNFDFIATDISNRVLTCRKASR